jgi:hypothetical protein
MSVPHATNTNTNTNTSSRVFLTYHWLRSSLCSTSRAVICSSTFLYLNIALFYPSDPRTTSIRASRKTSLTECTDLQLNTAIALCSKHNHNPAGLHLAKKHSKPRRTPEPYLWLLTLLTLARHHDLAPPRIKSPLQQPKMR